LKFLFVFFNDTFIYNLLDCKKCSVKKFLNSREPVFYSFILGVGLITLGHLQVCFFFLFLVLDGFGFSDNIFGTWDVYLFSHVEISQFGNSFFILAFVL
jgi:hypothetical protein